MKRGFWNLQIVKRWDWEIAPEMLNHNIFIYGKKKSGKTATAGIPYLQNAVMENKAVLLYTDKPEDYEDTIAYAEQMDYSVETIELSEIDPDEQEEVAYNLICDSLMKRKVLVFTNKNFKEIGQYTTLDSMLDIIAEREKDEIGVYKTQYAVVLDGMCGNMFPTIAQLRCRLMSFCLITCSEVARASWRRQMLIAAQDRLTIDIDDESRKLVLETLCCDQKQYWISATDFLFSHFIDAFRAYICTKIEGMPPQENKEFIGHTVMGRPEYKIGGAFAIYVHPKTVQKIQCVNTTHLREIEITDDIENTAYSQFSLDYIIPNTWIAEENGEPCIVFDGDGFKPVFFENARDGIEWIEAFLEETTDTEILLDSICDNDCVQITATEETTGNVREFALNFVTERDLDRYRFAYLLRVLHEAEVEDWMYENPFLVPEDGPNHPHLVYQAYDAWKQEQAKIQEAYEDMLTAPAEIAEPASDPELAAYTGGYRKKPQDLDKWNEQEQDNAEVILPKEGILFLGGHQNMTKHLKQLFPDWVYLSDDYFKKWRSIKQHIIFYWTGHSSHKMMNFVNARISDNTVFLYVTATNMNRLVAEMKEKYSEYLAQTEGVASLNA